MNRLSVLDPHQYQSLKNYLNGLTGGLSILGCIWVFWIFWKTDQRHRSISFKLILALSISDFMFSITNIMTIFDDSNEFLCLIEGILRVISVISALYFASAIAIWAYYVFSKSPTLIEQQKFFNRTIILGCILPFMISLIPFLTGGYYQYGYQTFGCYMVTQSADPSSTAKLMLFLLFDGFPVLVALGVTIRAYTVIAKSWKDLSKHLLIQQSDFSVVRLFLYPAVLFVAYIPSFIDNIIQIYLNSVSTSLVFIVIHIILTHSVGFSNAMVYVYLRLKAQDN